MEKRLKIFLPRFGMEAIRPVGIPNLLIELQSLRG